MATITHAGSTFNTTAGNKTVTATPAVGDLIVVVASTSGLAGGTTAVTDNNSSGTYTQVDTDRTGFSTTGVLTIWVRNSLVGAASSTVFTAAQAGSTGGGLTVLRISGMAATGSNAVRSAGGQSSGVLATTPAPVLSLTPLTTSAIIAAVANGTNSSTTVVHRSGYTEAFDNGYNNPATGQEVCYRNSGETSATLTFGGTSASIFASTAIELCVPISVTPGVPALTTTQFAPTVAVTNHKSVTTANPTSLTATRQVPTVFASDVKSVTTAAPSSLTTTKFLISVIQGTVITPSVPALTITRQTPTALATDHKVVSLLTQSLTTTRFSPIVNVSDNKMVTLGLATLDTEFFALSLALTDNKFLDLLFAELELLTHAPGVAISSNSAIELATATSLSTTRYPITVAATNNVFVNLNITAVTIIRQTPIVNVSDNKVVALDVTSLTTTFYEPTVELSSNNILTPGLASLSITRFASSLSLGIRITPGTPSLSLLPRKIILNGEVPPKKYYIDNNGNVYWIINRELGIREKV